MEWLARDVADGRALLFTTTFEGGVQKFHVSIRPALTGEFGAPMDLDNIVNTGVVSGSALSADGTTLIFDSNRPGGYGGYDLWITLRVKR